MTVAPPDSLADFHDHWHRQNGHCPTCVQQELLRCLLERGDREFHSRLQACWPLDPLAVYGALPTPLRMHADARFTGRGVTICFIDSGFYPHPDLTRPHNRIKAWVNASEDELDVREFSSKEIPQWPGWDSGVPLLWHGLMTSCVGAGNGFLSNGLYRGLASDSEVVLIRVRDREERMTEESMTRALNWVASNSSRLGIRVVNISVGGNMREEPGPNELDAAVDRVVSSGVVVVAASGNSGLRVLAPPATSPSAITVGGIDDKNNFDHHALELWNSNYGLGGGYVPKPDLVAPSLWVVAPLLCESEVAREAQRLFEAKPLDHQEIRRKALVTPHYKHVEGTSFAAPLCSAAVACMLEASPRSHPHHVKELLLRSAELVEGASVARQGAGVLRPGLAVAEALRHRHGQLQRYKCLPHLGKKLITFLLHDHQARRVQVAASWNQWREPLDLLRVDTGVWKLEMAKPIPGRHRYKFIVDDIWLDDPANPIKEPDGFGGYNSMFTV